LFQGSRRREGMGFSVVMVVSGGADPFHLSGRSPSTGRAHHIPKTR
jgi:hypothetical protein